MLFTFVALLATASFSAAAPAETVELPIEGGTESRAAYKPCQVLEPKCCPDNPFGFTIIGPPSLKCQQPASSGSESKFKASCEEEEMIPYCCTPPVVMSSSLHNLLPAAKSYVATRHKSVIVPYVDHHDWSHAIPTIGIVKFSVNRERRIAHDIDTSLRLSLIYLLPEVRGTMFDDTHTVSFGRDLCRCNRIAMGS
ncbi:hypothetical protein NLU13_3766 [Sarocladium strictum]|uniref:Uncharacterized protein n=1 Tax=Sarocladium strictum TaxID=5046 RepID=A0AA39GHM6_SARSR|nr:hypothetical protein NLU13_3766 [Sarocladium strictum]